MLLQLVNILLGIIKLPSGNYKVKISIYKYIILKFFIISITLARTGTTLPVVREVTPIN